MRHFPMAFLLIPLTTGEWLGLAPIPHGRTMEALETRLEDTWLSQVHTKSIGLDS